MSLSHPTIAPPNRPRAIMVRLALLAAAGLFSACAAWLIYRAYAVPVPESVFITRASPEWDGTLASVDGVNLARPRTAVFDKSSKYTISFHLPPGDYTFHVHKGDQDLISHPFTLSRRNNLLVYHLPESQGNVTPTTRPTWPFGIDFSLPGLND